MTARSKRKSINSLPELNRKQVEKNTEGPVVKKGIKELLEEVFGFIRVGGDFG